MKKLVAFIGVCSMYIAATAQSTIEKVNYQKAEHEAIVNEIPYPEKTIMNAIDNKMQQLGYKSKSSKGYTVYKAVRLTQLGGGEYDLYFSAERKSRRNKDNSTLTMLVSTGNDVFATENDNAALMDNAKKYMDRITDMVAAYDLDLQVAAQIDVVDKAIKKYNSLVDDGKCIDAYHIVRIKMHAHQIRMGQRNTHQFFLHYIFWFVDKFFHRVSLLKEAINYLEQSGSGAGRVMRRQANQPQHTSGSKIQLQPRLQRARNTPQTGVPVGTTSLCKLGRNYHAGHQGGDHGADDRADDRYPGIAPITAALARNRQDGMSDTW